jgi:hypothetical protein
MLLSVSKFAQLLNIVKLKLAMHPDRLLSHLSYKASIIIVNFCCTITDFLFSLRGKFLSDFSIGSIFLAHNNSPPSVSSKYSIKRRSAMGIFTSYHRLSPLLLPPNAQAHPQGWSIKLPVVLGRMQIRFGMDYHHTVLEVLS